MTNINLFNYPVRVYYEDTDTGGVVYYANYLKFFERARTEWLRDLGFQQQTMAEDTGCMFVVKDVQVHYKKPAQLDDLLTITAQLSELSRTSMVFEQTCVRQPQDSMHGPAPLLLSHGKITVVCVNKQTLRPCAIPSYIHHVLTSLTLLPKEAP